MCLGPSCAHTESFCMCKCEFMKSELRYLGHIIGKDGVQVDPHNVIVEKDQHVSQNVRDILRMRFLGLAICFWKFFFGHNSLATALTQARPRARPHGYGEGNIKRRSFKMLYTEHGSWCWLAPESRKTFYNHLWC